MHIRILLSLKAAMAIPLSIAGPVNTNISDLGINCEGSLKCNGQPDNTASSLVAYINGMGSDRSYSNGEHIACRINICAFLQGVPGPMGGEAIKSVAPAIVRHGCTVCGSVPTNAGNNVADGELTFNFVSNPSCGEGLC